MTNTTAIDSCSYLQFGRAVSRAPAGAGNDTASPPLTSGFGAVIEKEHDLQSATEGSFAHVSGVHGAETNRVLRRQHTRLASNIALLEQRYEALPKPERFVNWHDRGRPSTPHGAQHNQTDLLQGLVVQHTRLLADIKALICCAPDGQRGELILTEVGRSHHEMASALTALLNDVESVSRAARDRASVGDRRVAQQKWDNEVGLVRVDPVST